MENKFVKINGLWAKITNDIVANILDVYMSYMWYYSEMEA